MQTSSCSNIRRRLVLFGQCAPFILTCFTVLSGFIPCMYFHFDATLYKGETGIRGPQSLFGLLSESWSYVRKLINNGGGQANEQMFVIGAGILDVAVVLLCVMALFYTGVSAWFALRCSRFCSTDGLCNASKRRFRLLVWNRPCQLISELLLLPLLAYPYLMRNLYYNNAILNIQKITYTGFSFPIALLVDAAFLIALFLVLPRFEGREQLSLFRYYENKE